MGLLNGVLPAVYSASDTLKRKVGGLLSDPVGTLQQHVGLLNDNARSFNQLHSKATQESVNSIKGGGSGFGPASQQLAGKLADAYNPMGMVVWHGSPHKFSKFDSSKIGTGEGAQAYGHGLYLAESPDVAGTYASEVSQAKRKIYDNSGIFVNGKKIDPLDQMAGMYAELADKGAAAAISEREKAIAQLIANKGEGYTLVKLKQKSLENFKSLANSARDVKRVTDVMVDQPSPQLYKVDLPDDAIAKMLDWDKPLSQQAPQVKDAINRVGRSPEPYGLERVADDMRMVEMQKLFQSREGVEALRQHGIPGIRYLDGGSRGAGGGTSNFVVFPGNEGLLNILERNGQPIK